MPYHVIDEFAKNRGYDTAGFSDELKTLLDAEIVKPGVRPTIEQALNTEDPRAAFQTLAEESVSAALDEQVHDPSTLPFADVGRVVGNYVEAVSDAISELTDPNSEASDEFFGMLARDEDIDYITDWLANEAMGSIKTVGEDVAQAMETEGALMGLGQGWETILAAAIPGVLNAVSGASGGRTSGKPYRSDWQTVRDARAAYDQIKSFAAQSPEAAQAVDAVDQALRAADVEGNRNNVEGLRQNVQAAMGLIAEIKRAVAESRSPKAQGAITGATDKVTQPIGASMTSIFEEPAVVSGLSYAALGIGAIVLIKLATRGTKERPKA